jgi:hypothetical protein
VPEIRCRAASLVPDITEDLMVGPQPGGVVGMRLGDGLMEVVSGGEVAEHPCHRRGPRQVIGPVVGARARAVRVIGSRVLQSGVDEHRNPFPSCR